MIDFVTKLNEYKVCCIEKLSVSTEIPNEFRHAYPRKVVRAANLSNFSNRKLGCKSKNKFDSFVVIQHLVGACTFDVDL
jgi:hypothetical protein